METEIKLSPVGAATASQVFGDELLAPCLGEARRFDMESVYYHDEGGLLEQLRATLRLRTENGDGVCCLKITSGHAGAAAVREEYEVPAETIEDGAAVLSENTELSDELRAALGGPFAPVCACSFTRTEADYTSDTLSFVLSYDVGEYRKGELTAPLGEMELELKDGDVDALNALADAIVKKYGLTVSTRGKYRTAMALGEETC